MQATVYLGVAILGLEKRMGIRPLVFFLHANVSYTDLIMIGYAHYIVVWVVYESMLFCVSGVSCCEYISYANYRCIVIVIYSKSVD